MKRAARRSGATADTDLTNEQVALVALLLLAGDLEQVDTEDVAIRADALSPDRFRWRKYREHVDLGLVRNGLQDARKRDLVRGGAIAGWTLTEEGIREAKALLSKVEGAAARPRLTSQQRAWMSREKSRLLAEEAFRTLHASGMAAVSDRAILRFFRIDEYVTGDARQEKVDRLVRAFEDDDELSGAVKQLAERISG